MPAGRFYTAAEFENESRYALRGVSRMVDRAVCPPAALRLDDLAVLTWVMRTWAAELDAYRAWREARPAEQLKQAEALPRSDEEAR